MAKNDPAEPVLDTDLSPEEQEYGRNLVTFSLPDNPTMAEATIANDFVRVDHLSLRTFGPKAPSRLEIRLLLLNVAGLLQSRQPEAARALLSQAESVFVQHVQAKHRLRYLAGMLAGIILMIAFGFLLFWLLRVPDEVIPMKVLPLLLLFAGMGSVTSVLTRLSSIDLHDETNVWMIFLSGMARPVTGAFFALVVYLVLALRIVDFRLGVMSETPPSTPPPTGLFLLAAFMSGFSERFANDILGKFGATISPASNGKPPAKPKQPRTPESPK